MSAILKALKKLEQDTSSTASLPLRKEVKRHSQWRAKSFVMPVLVSVIISALVVAGSMVIFRNHSTDNTIKTARTSAIETSQAVKKTQADGQIEATLSQTLDSKDSASRTENIPSPVDALTSKASDTHPLNNNPHKSAVAQPVPYSGEFGSLQKYQPSAFEKNIQSNEPIRQDVEPEVRILEDPTLKLQAISWSSDPAQRMVVINAKICREKDRVDGYVVKKINSGDVVLSKGSVLGKLVFKIR